ncbi:hypothetical protein GXY_01946 [Novacetimonas hansenii ATCC 23769]|uniref:Uncharacterized protein n=1 Tax=Novacetimonas hansenii ATCC 23769 TaxID=714995 RepID=D5QB98_NOVHA|nr:hypothetical protein GXY_01946 [Novacetimonas hansenii ATCC 23769]
MSIQFIRRKTGEEGSTGQKSCVPQWQARCGHGPDPWIALFLLFRREYRASAPMAMPRRRGAYAICPLRFIGGKPSIHPPHDQHCGWGAEPLAER